MSKICNEQAAYNSHLDVVHILNKYHNEKCNINSSDCAGAIGHIELAEYLNA